MIRKRIVPPPPQRKRRKRKRMKLVGHRSSCQPDLRTKSRSTGERRVQLLPSKTRDRADRAGLSALQELLKEPP